ncbi:signal recognition particle-docking protein FtsY [Acetobacter orientalis]|uniref:Signal recognition particle-docking protein FtsY n=1 Tax=Acetobacter orientalis TaxID=146474 RepID=A0A2Z5ZJ67_9PROT|nr:signal recognition particle-docking protein FtsY [Acetobacter orientalis]
MALGFFSRLKQGLSRSTQKLGGGLSSVFTKRKLDDEALEELEDLLITADLGPNVAERVIESFRSSRFGTEVTDEEIRDALANEIATILDPVAIPFEPNPEHKPHVVLVVGVNGTGKTTTIGKMARSFSEQGKKVMMVAGDTFRAAAVEQLQVWGERTHCPVIAGPPTAMPPVWRLKVLNAAKRKGQTFCLSTLLAACTIKAPLWRSWPRSFALCASLTKPHPIRFCWCLMPQPAKMPWSRCVSSANW